MGMNMRISCAGLNSGRCARVVVRIPARNTAGAALETARVAYIAADSNCGRVRSDGDKSQKSMIQRTRVACSAGWRGGEVMAASGWMVGFKECDDEKVLTKLRDAELSWPWRASLTGRKWLNETWGRADQKKRQVN